MYNSAYLTIQCPVYLLINPLYSNASDCVVLVVVQINFSLCMLLKGSRSPAPRVHGMGQYPINNVKSVIVSKEEVCS